MQFSPLLQKYAHFLLRNINEVAIEQLKIAKEIDIPILRNYSHVSENELLQITRQRAEFFLKGIVEGTSMEDSITQIERFKQNELEDIKHEHAQAADFVLGYAIRKKMLIKMLPRFTNSVQDAMDILDEVENLHSKVQLKGFEAFLNFKEEELQFLLKLSLGITSTGNAEEALQFTLREICKARVGEAGAAWLLNETTRVLEYTTHYCIESEKLNKFCQKLVSSSFKKNCGLPGKAWARKNSVWVHDLTNEGFPEIGTELFKTAVAITIPLEGKVLGVIVIFIRESKKEKQFVNRFLNAVSGQIGIVVKQKKILEELKESELKFRSLVAAAPEAIIVTTEKGEIVSVNKATESIFGRKEDELLYKGHEILHPKKFRKRLKEMMKLHLESGEFNFYSEDEQIYGIRKNGEEFPVEFSIGSWKTADQIYFVEIIRDLSVRQEAEKLKVMYKHIIESTADSVLSKTLNGTIITWNPASEKIYGYPAEEIIGKNIITVIPEEKLKENRVIQKKIRKGEIIKDLVTERIRKDGSRVFLSLTISPMRDENGKIIGANAIGLDITERVRAEKERENLIAELEDLNQELEERVIKRTERLAKFAEELSQEIAERELAQQRLEMVNQELQDFAAIVTHDLKTPLNNMAGITDWLNADYREALADEGKNALDLMQRSIDRMKSLIDAVLKFSRAGMHDMIVEDIHLENLLMDVEEHIKIPVNFEIKHENTAVTVLFDRVLLMQIMQNLIDNAIKYNDKPKGKITIGCADKGEFWEICVQDNGPGIEEKYHDKIFRIFQKLPSSEGREDSSGIGLGVVSKIVRKNGGKIWVESENRQGTTFYFTIRK